MAQPAPERGESTVGQEAEVAMTNAYEYQEGKGEERQKGFNSIVPHLLFPFPDPCLVNNSSQMVQSEKERDYRRH